MQLFKHFPACYWNNQSCLW